jgi:predicted DCC family thiol-disulfide oxidoreductase YuxK
LKVPYVAVEEYAFLVPYGFPEVLVFEKWALVVVVVAFTLGYRLRATASLGAVLLGHLALVRFTLDISGNVTALFFAVYFLIFLGIYHDPDPLTVDGLLSSRERSLGSLADRLKSPSTEFYRFEGLRWSLLAVAVVYFGSGFDKLSKSGIEWAAAPNLSRIIVVRHYLYDQPFSIGLELVQYPQLVEAMALGTLLLETGLLIVILAGRFLTPIVVGILGLKLGILVVLGIFFGDVFSLFAVFFAWDALHERLASSRRVDVVFDERCHFCARSLLPFDALDVNETITFYSQSDLPEEYRDLPDIDYGDAMYLFADGEAYEGYYAFRELVRQFGLLGPLAWVMDRRPVAFVGVRIYRYVAANRSRHFTCAVNTDVSSGDTSGLATSPDDD